MNQNFNLAKELAEQSEKDWKFGALSQPGIVSIPQNERDQWLPKGEEQFDQYGDFTDCASRSPVNHLEALFTYHYQHNMIPTNKKWMEDKGYIQNGKVTFSDRFIAILSGTTREGNSLKAPLEAIRKNGLIPKSLLPKEDWMKWEDYYDSSKITQELRTLGQDFLARFTINYEQVAQIHFQDVLIDDMIGTAGYAWPTPINGVYPSTDNPFNHAFLLYNLPKWQIFDNYLDWDGSQKVQGDFTKNLASDYKFFDYGYRVYVSNELDVALKISLLKQLVQALLALIGLYKAPTPQPSPTPVPAPEPPVIEDKPQPAPIPPAPVVHPDGFAQGTLEERKAMVTLACRVCDEEGLSTQLRRDLLLTVCGESGWNQWCVNHTTKDYGLCQFSAKYYLKEYNMTPQDALENPEKCLRIMARNFKAGRQSNWVAYGTRNLKRNTDMLTQLS